MALIAKGVAESSLNRFYPLFHLISWGVSAVLSVPFISHIGPLEPSVGPTTWYVYFIFNMFNILFTFVYLNAFYLPPFRCAVKGDWVIGSFFVPLVVLFIFNFVCILYIIAKYL